VTDGPHPLGAGEAGPAGAAEPAGSLRRWSGWRHELLLAVELLALSALAFARPVLDSFGRSPETFIARGADARTVVLFALVVTLAPPLALAAAGLLARAFGPCVRWVVHLVLVGVVASVAVRRLVGEATAWPAFALLAAGLVGGVALALSRWRLVGVRAFLRFAGAASAVYLVQFLALSPTGDLVIGEKVGVDAEVAASVDAALGDDPPDVVLLTFDALPLDTLLDGDGAIDPQLFPNFAALAGTSTWYRNNTSVSMYTRDAVPAILTGRYPDPENRPNDGPSTDPENLFTLLGGTYDLHVGEQITRLCPEELCPRRRAAGLGRLARDAVDWWRGVAQGDETEDEFSLPALLDDDRFGEAEDWIADERPEQVDDPDLMFFHAAIPHDPWQFLPDGTIYDTERYPVGYHRIGWYGPGIGVGRQRHVLQAMAADTLLGDLLDRLRAAGTFDDTLVVVTADHGHAFVPDTPWRWLNRDNYEQLMWAPLLVKSPGQSDGEVVDDNVMSIDIVPTIADILGVDLPWDVDGRPARQAGERDQDLKYVDDDEDNYWRADEGHTLVTVSDAEEAFRRVIRGDAVEGTGPDAIWRRTPYGDLVFRDVDDLDVGAAWGGTEDVAVDDLDRLADIDTGEPLPLEAIGRSDLETGTYVAYALNGTVGAVAEVEEDDMNAQDLLLGLLPPELFADGSNELTAYVVEGAPGGEQLRPLPVVEADD
jgi:ABC-type amino acid transport substrate-binding protein